MLISDRLQRIKEERARRFGGEPAGYTGEDFNSNIERIRQERQDRLTAVWEAQHPQEETQKKKLNQPINPAEDPKNQSWWGKTLKYVKENFQKGYKQTGEVIKGTVRLPITIPTKVLTTLTGEEQYTPETKTEKFLTGEEPVTSYTEDQKRIEEWSKSKGLTSKQAIGLGVAGAIGEVGLDFWFGKGNAGKQIIKAVTEKEARNIIEKAGVKETPELINRIINTTNKSEAEMLAKELKSLSQPLQEGVNPLIQEARKGEDLSWARGTRAAGIQRAGLKNYNQATKVLEKAGELPSEIKTPTVTKDFIKNYYETKKPPVIGDTFINARGEKIEITKVGDKQVDYFLKGKKKGIAGTIYSDNGFKMGENIPVNVPPKATTKVATKGGGSTPQISQPLPEGGKVVEEFNPEKYVQENVAKMESARVAEKGTIWDRVKSVFRKAKSELVDSQSAIEDVLTKSEKQNRMKILESKDYRMQYPKVLRSSEQAKTFIQDNYSPIIRKVDNLDNLEEYLKAKHAIELENLGKKTGRNVENDKKLVEAFKEKYEPFAQEVKNSQNKLLDYLVDSGIKSRADVDLLKKTYPEYVPFNRIFTDAEEEFLDQSFGKRNVAGLSQQTVIQKLKGSEREVESPFASMFEKTQKAFEQGERNKAGQMMADYNTLPKNPFGLEKITEGVHKGPAEQTFSFFKDGIKETWKIDPEYAKALKNMDANELGLLGQILAVPVRIAKVGITGLRPSFWLKNIGRDQITAFINADKGMRGSILNPKNFFESLYSIIKKDDIYKQIISEGGSYTSFDFWRNAAIENVNKVRASKNLGSKIKYKITHPGDLFRTLENIVSKSEELTRAQQGRAAYSAAIKEGRTAKDAAIIGARAYRETTVDFMRSGNLSKTLNNALMYFNPGIQGSRTLIRNLKTKPIKTSAKIISTVMLPMAYVTSWNLSDDKRREAYQDIPEWEKENNLIFIPPNPTKDESGKWNIIKIPYSQEIAQLTRPVRRVQESMAGLDPVKFGEIADALFQTATSLNVSSPKGFASTATPQALKPTLETVYNKKFYTGAPVVPAQMEKFAPEAQFYTNETKSGQKRTPTSGTIKALASKLGLSPIKTEFWINETFGGLSENIINNIDTIASKMGVVKPEEIGGEGFLKSIAAAYNKAYGGETVSKKYNTLDEKIKEISKLDPEDRVFEIQDYISSLPEEERRSALSAMRNLGTAGVSISEDIIRMKPTYNKIKELLAAGKEKEAKELLSSLSEEDIKAFKKVKSSIQSKKTKQSKLEMRPTFDKIKELVAQGKKSEAREILSKMSDEELRIFKLLKESS